MNNKTIFNADPSQPEDLLPEYNFNYSKAHPNRFATDTKQNQDLSTDSMGNLAHPTGNNFILQLAFQLN